jgi:drug/metabolite transporter (DMT)-like permease
VSHLAGAPNSPGRFDRTALGLYAATVLIWGTSWIALRLQLGVVAPEVSLVWRFAIAGVVMLVLALVTRERLAYPLRDHMLLAVLGVTLFSGNFLLFYYGGATVPSGLLSVVFSLASVGNLVLAAVIFRQRTEPLVALGGLLGVAGVAAMFAPEIGNGAVGAGAVLGLVQCVLGTLVFCIGNIVATSVRRRGVSLVASTVWGLAYGTAFLFIVALLRGRTFTIDMQPSYLGSLLYLAIVASVFAFTAYLRLLDRIGAARAGYTTVVIPVVALVISTIFEGYVWTASALTGLALVLLGNWLVLARRRS